MNQNAYEFQPRNSGKHRSCYVLLYIVWSPSKHKVDKTEGNMGDRTILCYVQAVIQISTSARVNDNFNCNSEKTKCLFLLGYFEKDEYRILPRFVESSWELNVLCKMTIRNRLLPEMKVSMSVSCSADTIFDSLKVQGPATWNIKQYFQQSLKRSIKVW